ncbi:molybdate ABC transporter substrate-binding protein [Qaidamihabitans albus]|uniref:molybdate ABC transporter substrate-binding protein n=1 Tax=Qaidamihabitans albus TaxID=2795733 RepID=UPI0018F1AC94|nr:molybdate ABC transporter substrate-binding protein [Qaidamihabitans albus]
MRGVRAALAATVLAAASACAPAGEGTALTVFAAASLTDSFGALAERFEADHAGVDVRLNLAGSARLAQQIQEGAPADVYASANERTMREVAAAGRVEGEPRTFATNRLTIAVAPGNPLGIESFADLAEPGLTVVVCAPPVPCGSAAEEIERITGVTLRPASEEQNVKAVLTKVRTGEADAGLVYVTDVLSAGQEVAEVELPEAARASNDYPVAVLKDAAEPELAREFRDFVFSDVGRQELLRAGFGAP